MSKEDLEKDEYLSSEIRKLRKTIENIFKASSIGALSGAISYYMAKALVQQYGSPPFQYSVETSIIFGAGMAITAYDILKSRNRNKD